MSLSRPTTSVKPLLIPCTIMIANNAHNSAAAPTALQVNQDGIGTDWVNVAILNGSNFIGVTADSLTASGQLIANQPL